MKISRQVIKELLLFCTTTQCETGGILGFSKSVIDHVIFDVGLKIQKCSYAPDVDYLNSSIAKWSEKGISFAGVYHTHFFGIETLSHGDIEYIKEILSAMPEEITRLYFPIVLPEYQRIVVYIAEKTINSISIHKDEIMIIDEN